MCLILDGPLPGNQARPGEIISVWCAANRGGTSSTHLAEFVRQERNADRLADASHAGALDHRFRGDFRVSRRWPSGGPVRPCSYSAARFQNRSNPTYQVTGTSPIDGLTSPSRGRRSPPTFNSAGLLLDDDGSERTVFHQHAGRTARSGRQSQWLSDQPDACRQAVVLLDTPRERGRNSESLRRVSSFSPRKQGCCADATAISFQAQQSRPLGHLQPAASGSAHFHQVGRSQLPDAVAES